MILCVLADDTYISKKHTTFISETLVYPCKTTQCYNPVGNLSTIKLPNVMEWYRILNTYFIGLESVL
jgi:hypothetical protein